MPTSDDELRELFSKGRADDRANAPTFDDTWGAAQKRRGSGLRIAIAIAVAAAILLVAGWIVIGERGYEPVGGTEEVAETNPQPDLPNEEPPEVDDHDDELAALAAWEPSLETPTDFLLEEDGVLGGGLPSTDLSESFLDLDELTMEL